MSWNKIKSIMICFLVAINIFLLAFLSITVYRKNTIPDKVLNASIAVLKKEGFDCNTELLPKVYYTLPAVSAQFYSAADLSDLFFKRQLAFRTVENSLVASEGKATLTINGNFFTYESGYAPDSTASPKKIKRALKKLGIDMSGAVYDEKSGYFYCMYKNLNLFNMYIQAKLDDSGEICYVSAQWPSKLSPMTKRTFSFNESIMNLEKIFPSGGKITAIEAGYCLRSANSSEKYVFSPAWRVNVDGESKIVE